MYTLDFETIQQVMQAHQKTGFLTAELPSGVNALREPCRIEISLQVGKIVSCAIVGKSGRRLTGKEALQAMGRLGRLNWTFTPRQEEIIPSSQPLHSTSPLLAPIEYAFIPRRTAQLESWQVRGWPRIHRAIFALADGTKSVSKIAEMLSIAPDVAVKALRDLHSLGVVVLGPQDEKNIRTYF